MTLQSFHRIYKRDRLLLGIFILIILALLVQSRAMIIGYFIAFITVFFIKYPIKNKLKVALFVAGLVLLQTFLLAFAFKKDSTFGRILIYKISCKILVETFPLGIGPQKFELIYGNYQMKYFESEKYTNKELLLADNVEYCYNDYLQIIIEYGAAGILLIVFLMLLLYKIIIRSLKVNEHNPDLLLFAIAQIIALFIAGCFTFMIYQSHWQVILLLSLGVVIMFNRFYVSNYILISLALLLIYIAGSHYQVYIFNQRSAQRRVEALELSKSGYFEEATALYSRAFADFKGNDAFVREYARCLILSRQFEMAEKLMKDLMLVENSSFNFDILAECYRKTGNLKAAEINYLKSIHKVPNKFYSRFNLFSFYTDTRQVAKAIKVGRGILSLPVKIRSDDVHFIKQAVRKQLKVLEH